MYKSKYFILIFFILFFTRSYARDVNSVNLCLTGKIESTLPTYKSAFLNAAYLALSEHPKNTNINLITYLYDNKPLAAARTYREMLRDNCNAIIGFEYLSDLILVTKLQPSTQIPIFTSYASSSDSDKYPKNIFISSPSYDYQANKMIDFLHKKFGQIDNALVMTEISRTDLVKYKTAYTNLLNRNKTTYDIFDFVSNDSQFENKLNQLAKHKHYKYIFVFSGAVGSTKIINHLDDHKIIFIGTENFGSSTNQSVYVRLNNKTTTSFIIRNIDFLKTNKLKNAFKRKYIERFSIEPSPLSAYTYDSVTIIMEAIERFNSASTNDILKLNYKGITGVTIKDNIFHRSNEYVILSIGKKGFIYEE